MMLLLFYNNESSFWILIGQEMCVIIDLAVHTHSRRHPMAWCTSAGFFLVYLSFFIVKNKFLCFCTVHRRRYSMWIIKVTPHDIVSCRTFLFFARHDVICDLSTPKWNLFVKYGFMPRPLRTCIKSKYKIILFFYFIVFCSIMYAT